MIWFAIWTVVSGVAALSYAGAVQLLYTWFIVPAGAPPIGFGPALGFVMITTCMHLGLGAAIARGDGVKRGNGENLVHVTFVHFVLWFTVLIGYAWKALLL